VKRSRRIVAEPAGEATIENGASFGERSEPKEKPQPEPNVTYRRKCIVAIGMVAAMALTACGGDDDTGSSATTSTPASATDPTDPSDPSDPSEVVPTIAPDLPEEFLDGVGPVAVVGEPLPAFPIEGDDPAVGMAAPVLVGETFDGESIRIDATIDGPTWVVFLAHWCPHCNDEIPVINQLRDEGRIPEGVNVVGVSTAFNPGRPNWPPDEWLDDKDWTFTAIPDGIDIERETYIAADAFGIGGFPFSMLVDGDGTVTARWSGERPIDELESLVTSNLSLG
jgi:thiol-disulfide isomerase/thioredoxin